MTPEQLAVCAGITVEHAVFILPEIERVFLKRDISTPIRQIEFSACFGVETGFKLQEENLNYSASRLLVVFPKPFIGKDIDEYTHNPKKIANLVYAGHNGNGDEASGDGWNFRGRGWPQLTGRGNYKAAGIGIGIDLEKNPEKMLEIRTSAMVCGWFWGSRNLNVLADAGNTEKIAYKENGSLRGVEDRIRLVEAGKKAFGIT